jgi:putative sterol carrier protein
MDDIESLKKIIEDQHKQLERLQERNTTLSNALSHSLKDVVFYQSYAGNEVYRSDFKTAAEMRKAMYHWKDIAEGKKDK